MIQIEESNPSFESCHKCIYSDDSEETCILRRCIHAVAQLKECYVPKPQVVRCYECKHNPKKEWFGCPMSHLNERQRPEDAWCWKGER